MLTGTAGHFPISLSLKLSAFEQVDMSNGAAALIVGLPPSVNLQKMSTINDEPIEVN